MKIDKLDAHDRYQKFINQDFSIGECCQNLIDQRPFGNHPFYIFAHTRTDEDGVTKRMIWQPRLTKPKAQTNSMLFKAFPGTDQIRVIWMLPVRELWGQFVKGKMTESNVIADSIHDFVHNRQKLDSKEEDDLSDEKIDAIYKQISLDAKRKKVIAEKTIS